MTIEHTAKIPVDCVLMEIEVGAAGRVIASRPVNQLEAKRLRPGRYRVNVWVPTAEEPEHLPNDGIALAMKEDADPVPEACGKCGAPVEEHDQLKNDQAYRNQVSPVGGDRHRLRSTREIDSTQLVRCVCDEPLLPKSPPRSGIEGDPVRCGHCGRVAGVVIDPEKVAAIERVDWGLACACGAAGQELHEPDCEVGYPPKAANADPDPLPPGQDFRRFEKVPGKPGQPRVLRRDMCSACFNFVPPVGQRTAECPSCGALYEEHPVLPWSAKALFDKPPGT